MPYSEMMVAPMRKELTSLGLEELRTPEEVDAFVRDADGTAMIAVNSICGCSAGSMRPAVAMALENGRVPDRTATVFAGQDLEATERARGYFTGYAPSSPCIALLKDGELRFMLERHQIQGREPREIAAELTAAFDREC